MLNAPRMIAPSRSVLPIAIGLVCAVGVVYFNSLSAPFVFDDRASILENPSIRTLWPITSPLSPPAGGLSVSGRPLVNLSLAFNYAIGGTDPKGYHAFNVLVHALAALTLFGIVRRTWRRTGRGGADAALTAGAVALLWALHPLQTAAVTYVIQRAEALMGLFYLFALYSFIRAVEAESSNRSRLWLGASVVVCALGMATKEVMVTAPLLVLLYDRTFVAGGFLAAWRRRTGYYLSLAGTWLVLVPLLLGSHGRAGTAGFDAGISVWRYLLTQAEAIALYLRLSVWPHPLVFDHGERLVSGVPEVWFEALVVVALLMGVVVALRRHPMLGFLGAWFFVILAPSSSVVPIASHTIAEHRMYLPLAAVVVAVAAAAQAWWRKGFVSLLLLAVVAGGFTIARNRTYRSEAELWADAAAKAPTNARAHANLGGALLDAGQVAEAVAAYEEAARLQPKWAEIRANLCHVYARLGRLAEAVTEGRMAIQLAPENAAARINLASVLLQTGRVEEAIEHLTVAHRVHPGAADVARALADALVQQAQTLARGGRIDEARRQTEEALRVAPGHVEAEFLRGNLAAAAQDFGRATTAYRRVLALAPDHVGARNNLANVFLVTGQVREAIDAYREVLRLRPNDRSVQENLQRAQALQAERR